MNLSRMIGFYNKYNQDEDFHIHIFHHFDADGYGAATVLARPFVNFNVYTGSYDYIRDVQFHVCEHSHPMDLGSIDLSGKNLVFIVDYSFSREDDKSGLLKLMDYENVCLVWMDHHVTSEKIIAEEPRFKDIIGINVYGMKYAGVFLAFTYFYPIDWSDISFIFIREGYKFFENSSIDEDIKICENNVSIDDGNTWILLISDYDTWTHEFPESKLFTKGLYYEGMYNSFLNLDFQRVEHEDEDDAENSILRCWVDDLAGDGKIKYIADCDFTYVEHRVYKLIELGKTLTMIDKKRDAKKVANNAFEATIHINFKRDYIDPKHSLKIDPRFCNGDMINADIKVLFMNSGGNSITFGDKVQEYDAVSLFTFNGDMFTYSLYSKEDGFQCNILALFFNVYYGITGGGHDHAAGWTTPEVDFRKDRHYTITEDSFIDDTEP